MKLALLATALLVAFSALPATAAGTVAVTLDVGYVNHLLPSPTSCTVLVADGATVAETLDAAVAQGCISGWTAVDYGTPGSPNRFVACIETLVELCGQDAVVEGAFWGFYMDGVGAAVGVDGAHVHAGTHVQFTYEDYYSFLLP